MSGTNLDPIGKDNSHSILEYLTFVNAVGEPYRVWIVFFFTIIYSIMGHSFLYFLEAKNKKLKSRLHEDPSELTDVNIAHHCLMLRGLSKAQPI